jgi:peptidoglycan/LPS O-acetylase OafA/YrhL
MANKDNNKHNSGIDILRGLAIFSVILLHVNIRIPFSSTFIGSAMPAYIYKILFWSGYYGVCIFFVISGFLITTSALNKWGELPKLSLSGFYTMRFARIMPMLVALLVVLSVLHLTGVNGFVINTEKTSLGHAIFAALTFHINWLEIKTGYLPGAWDILWSLSIEEVFYLFFPLVFILIRKEKYFVFLVLAFLVISPFARTVWFLDYGFNEPDRNHFAFLDAISIGCLAAIVTRRFEIKKSILRGMAITGWAMMALILIFRSVAHDLHLGQTGLNVTVLAIGTALVLMWMQKRFMNGLQKPMFSTAAIRFFGRNSYEVYLTHMFVVYAMVNGYNTLKLSGEWAWGLYISVFIFSGLLGEFVAQKFSNPVNVKLRKQLDFIIKKTA